MKKISVSFAMVCLLTICFSSVVNGQAMFYDDEVAVDIFRGIRNIIGQMDKSFESIRGKQLSKDDDGTLMYEFKAPAVNMHVDINMHAESQYIFIPKINTMGFYFANFGSDTAVLNKSLQAFIKMGDPWPEDLKLKNPWTVEKDLAMSKDGKVVYVIYSTGLKIAMYTLDVKKGNAVMLIGFINHF